MVNVLVDCHVEVGQVEQVSVDLVPPSSYGLKFIAGVRLFLIE